MWVIEVQPTFAKHRELEPNCRRYVGENCVEIVVRRNVGDNSAIVRRPFWIRQGSANVYEFFIFHEIFVAFVTNHCESRDGPRQVCEKPSTGKNDTDFVHDKGLLAYSRTFVKQNSAVYL